MGIIFGSLGVNEFECNTLKSVPYEIRTYESCFVAETTSNVANEAFEKLAKYFGSSGSAENNIDAVVPSAPSASGIPMDGRNENIPMTVPVLTENDSTQFLLPTKYNHISEVPVPTDPNVAIKQLPKRIVAVLRFYGWVSAVRCQRKFETLRQMLMDDGFLDVISPVFMPDSESVRASSCRSVDWSTPLLQGPSYQLAQYHSSFTLPCCRRAEIWITLDSSNERVAELLKTADDPTYSTRSAVQQLMESPSYEDPLDAEYGSEHEEVNQELEVPTSLQVRRRASKIVSSAEKFLSSG